MEILKQDNRLRHTFFEVPALGVVPSRGKRYHCYLAIPITPLMRSTIIVAVTLVMRTIAVAIGITTVTIILTIAITLIAITTMMPTVLFTLIQH